MVERIEGLCGDAWKRAYREMNEFEKELSDWGAVILKFWLHIDKDTQLERFSDRQNTPEKRWKITDEDWLQSRKMGSIRSGRERNAAKNFHRIRAVAHHRVHG